MSKIDEAIAFGAMAHAGQKRKFTGEPYIVHPVEVLSSLITTSFLPVTEEMMIAAVLHDVLEDTPVGLSSIQRRFGVEVGNLVVELTDQFTDPAHGNRAKRKELERQRQAKMSAQAQSIKYADLISNTKTIAAHDPGFARIYLEEKSKLLDVMVDGDLALMATARSSL